MMTAPIPDDIPQLDLDKGINVNKNNEEKENCTLREKFGSLTLCRQINSLPYSNEKPTNTTSDYTKTVIQGANHTSPGSYDLYSIVCFRQVNQILTDDLIASRLAKDYSILIFSLGIWETVRPFDCGGHGLQYIVPALDALKEFAIQNPSIKFVWKTHGGSRDDGSSYQRSLMVHSIQNSIRGWFNNNGIDDWNDDLNQKMIPPNLMLADFALEIQNRTYGESRIKGDVAPHFGIEARTLSIQLITEQLNRHSESLCGV